MQLNMKHYSTIIFGAICGFIFFMALLLQPKQGKVINKYVVEPKKMTYLNPMRTFNKGLPITSTINVHKKWLLVVLDENNTFNVEVDSTTYLHYNLGDRYYSKQDLW